MFWLLSRWSRWLILPVMCGVAIGHAAATHAAEANDLIRFEPEFDTDSIKLQDAQVAPRRHQGQPALKVVTGQEARWPGITIPCPRDAWDLSAFAELSLRVQNTGTDSVTVHCRVDNPGGDGAKNCITKRVTLKPGAGRRLSVPLRRQLPPALAEKLFGMRGYPGGLAKEGGLDPSRIVRLIIFVSDPQQDHEFLVADIRAEGAPRPISWLSMSPEEFFPMIDRFGQFRHKDWPGKVHSEDDLKQRIDVEQADRAAHPGPQDWNQYGGWSAGPKLEATGHFRTQKHQGKWWLVDPEGRLFWSHGTDCVRFGNATTPISDREFYFADLPPNEPPYDRFYGRASWAPHGYYQDKGVYRTFNFTGVNLLRKYGSDWSETATQLCHQRLRSWAMNTIANWSDAQIYLQRQTPYVVSAGSGGAKPIEGSSGYWGKFPDPFDPSFREALDRRLAAEKGRSANDPWCIGYFVDNELAWGSELSLAVAALASPPDQAAKRAFVADLKASYSTIADLNRSWGTDHTSWQALLDSRTPPDEKKAKDDLGAFYTKIAETYFRHCREAVKQVAPNNLYLGCRFAWVNDRGARAAARYCDVIGYNLYRDDVADFELPPGVDMPVIIGEFHFGALDRGMFHTGLRPTASQQERAEAYRNYVNGALRNPVFVGTHWFQYGDQATTGRGDGENYQIGLVDVCDTPYPETIEAVRAVGHALYRTRIDSP